MLKIPLHALIVMVGPSGAGKSIFVDKYFKLHEVISSDNIREELTGDFRNQHANDLVTNEFYRRVEMKLSLGERVVADASHIRKKDRVHIALIGAKMHVPVIYIVVNRTLDEKLATAGWRADVPGLIQKHEQTFQAQENDILSGDNMATVIDTRSKAKNHINIEIVDKPNFYDLQTYLKNENYAGIAIIGDVHGMARDFQKLVNEARSENRFIIQLGDIVDYGPDAVGSVDIMYKLVMNGEGAFIIGNHERKLERYFKQKAEGNIRIEVKGGMVQTLEQLDRLDDTKEAMFEAKFKALMNYARHHILLAGKNGVSMFVHAASSRKMWESKASRLVGFEENRAVFGEIDQENPTQPDGFPARLYNWIDEIEDGNRVYVGHAVRSVDEILIVDGKLGGKAFFVDTGSGKWIQDVQGFLSMVKEDLD